MPSLTVTAAVQFPTGTGARNRDLQHFTGPIPALLEDIMIWCHRNLTSARTYREDGHMTERPELPLTAVRELVANALVHRDLGPESVGMEDGACRPGGGRRPRCPCCDRRTPHPVSGCRAARPGSGFADWPDRSEIGRAHV